MSDCFDAAEYFDQENDRLKEQIKTLIRERDKATMSLKAGESAMKRLDKILHDATQSNEALVRERDNALKEVERLGALNDSLEKQNAELRLLRPGEPFEELQALREKVQRLNKWAIARGFKNIWDVIGIEALGEVE